MIQVSVLLVVYVERGVSVALAVLYQKLESFFWESGIVSV